ncbi:rare lipoprotein B [Psychromonas sp. CNPT3]|uniref:LPS-assembly lipoprotein LptE n=1 Tax=Psychromonas sp. CNPT3 TaxID=314282 RepID=UPI00006E4423|nr:LPS assembly lipoprotein LptE [Psychromonas sp. CNPT3]AGH80689.1 rare lipoprotein B [Psychromonas sp. CNPT3]
MFIYTHRHFYAKLLSFFTAFLLLSGCGFHIKNSDGLVDKYPQIYVKSTRNSDLTRFVLIRLRGAGIEIVDTPNENVAKLLISSPRRSERTISLYSNAQNAEQELGYNIEYSITRPGQLTQNFKVNLYRDFLDDPAQALAKSREAELLTKELDMIAADHIISTMLSLKSTLPSPSEP